MFPNSYGVGTCVSKFMQHAKTFVALKLNPNINFSLVSTKMTNFYGKFLYDVYLWNEKKNVKAMFDRCLN